MTGVQTCALPIWNIYDILATTVMVKEASQDPEINDTKSYDNHKLIVPSYLCTPVAVDKDNYQKELVDSNYYKAADLGL